MKLIKPILDKFLTEWLIILTCVGYPIQTMVVILLKVEHTPMNIGFRSVYLLISMYLILSRVIRKGPRPSPVLFVFIMFWAIYGTRLIYDLEIKGLTYMGYSKFYVYSWAFACSFSPAFAVLLNPDRINHKRLSINLFLILIVGNIFIAASMIYFSPNGFTGIFLSRFNLYLVIKGSTYSWLINAVSISFYGELLCLAALVFLIVYHKVISLQFSLLLWFIFSLGMFNLLDGASRGPMASFILIAMLIIIYAIFSTLNKLIRKCYTDRPRDANYSLANTVGINITTSKIKRLMITIIGPLIIITSLNFVPGTNKFNFAMLGRMIELGELRFDANATQRVSIWESALKQFETHPYLGDSFVNNYEKMYAHNIILDSLMSTGLLGTIPFLFYFANPFFLFYKLNRTRKRQLSLVFILFLAALLLYMTSGGLFTSAEFWILSAAVIGISQQYIRKLAT